MGPTKSFSIPPNKFGTSLSTGQSGMAKLSSIIVHKKEDPKHICITVGGNLINYPFELTTCTTDMVSSKFLWKSMISTKGACFAGANIKNMYVDTSLNRYEYTKMTLSLFPTGNHQALWTP